MSSKSLFIGFDLSTQQLKAIAIDEHLAFHSEYFVLFDRDLPQYKTCNGVLKEGPSVVAPVAMWVEALDLLLNQMKIENFPFQLVKGISGAGQQHGSVYWSGKAEEILKSYDIEKPLHEQISEALSHPMSPNWQDSSTSVECHEFEESAGGPKQLAEITGSKAHHRFTGPQILSFRKKHPEKYEITSRISLVSSFLASVLVGRIVEMDISDVCGANLWDVQKNEYCQQLMELTAGSAAKTPELNRKLGSVVSGDHNFGSVSTYFQEKFRFNKDCVVISFTGDNPSTILSLPLHAMDVVLSLGTSTTLLLLTPSYIPHPSYHLFKHPTTNGLYMSMLCYKNGGLAREQIRDTLEPPTWETFNEHIIQTEPFGGQNRKKLGYYYPLDEIIPPTSSSLTRFSTRDNDLVVTNWENTLDPRIICESQALSCSLRARPLLNNKPPRRLYVVGGGSRNSTIIDVFADVIGGDVFIPHSGNACAQGAANKAAWAVLGNGKSFETFVQQLEGTCARVRGFDRVKWNIYQEILDLYEKGEQIVVEAGSTSGRSFECHD
ncbi:putative D-xylulose kinase A [Neolecta irregularis DAH-3]|uniref:Xylulose kinase n=1 Tax=Neolecta irregularis (strain DAH-3) TaxID=1198029 RepID=A0A1U7LS31_NEOID|nr:putative D-xylulose kinase A [Neolecta irregularis DAH-3]|eukprot:OLL25480.1 putative D-xylulose kinase A [Neolecta irregularis DAH-3]